MSDSYFKERELNQHFFDIILRFLGIIIGVYVGVWQFNRQQWEIKSHEFNKTLWQKKIENYEKTCTSVGAILSAVRTDMIEKNKYQSSVDSFYFLYWGQAKFLSDSIVTVKLDELRYEIDQFNVDEFNVNDKYQLNKLAGLKAAGQSVINACQTSSKVSLNDILNENRNFNFSTFLFN